MSLLPLEEGPVNLIIEADPGAEVTVVDHGLRLCGRGWGGLRGHLEPGVYKASARAGSAIRQQLIEVPADGTLQHVNLRNVAFSSAAPLQNTLRIHEYHMEPAQVISRGPAHALGQGGQLFVFSRYWAAQGVTPTHPMVPLSLATLEGTPLLELNSVCSANMTVEDPYAGCLLELTPGAYRLRVQTQALGQIEQTIIVAPGWQTQVFMLMRDIDDSPQVEFVPDPATSAILMARKGLGFQPSDAEVRLGELARDGLMRGVCVLSPDEIEMLLHLKFTNPMVGLLGVHSLMLGRTRPPENLSVVLENLRRVFALDHPDVSALEVAYLGSRRTVAVPPMISRSYRLLVTSPDNEAVVPEGSLCARIASARWGTRTWLTWLAEEVESEEPQSYAAPAAGMEAPQVAEGAPVATQAMPSAAWSNYLETFVRSKSDQDIEQDERFNPTEQAILRQVQNRVRPSLRQSNAPDPDWAASDVARSLGLPQSSFQRAVGKLNRKLGSE